MLLYIINSVTCYMRNYKCNKYAAILPGAQSTYITEIIIIKAVLMPHNARIYKETLKRSYANMSRWFNAMIARISTCIVFHELWSCSGMDGRGRFRRMDREEVSGGEMRLMYLEHVRQWHIVYVLGTYKATYDTWKQLRYGKRLGDKYLFSQMLTCFGGTLRNNLTA